MRSRNWIRFATALSVFVIGYGILAPSALPQLWQMRLKEKALRSQIHALRQKLSRDGPLVNLLAGDSEQSLEYIEKVARHDLGMVGPGEVLLVLSRTSQEQGPE